MEVLIAMFVLSIGLLGVAALIPMGRFGIVETGKADRSGACGHAALSEIKVRQMLDPYPWRNAPAVGQWVWANGNDAAAAALAGGSFAIDPLGVAKGLPANLGGGTVPLPRITLRPVPTGSPLTLTLAEADRIFTWHDDLEFSLPKDIKPPPRGESARPRANLEGGGLPGFAGSYSWLVTVMPAAAETGLAVADRTLFSVSVVVCYRRDYSLSDSGQPNGEHTASVKILGQGYGGGSVELIGATPVDPPLRLRENEWIMLCGQVSGRTVCKWYRVVSADSQSPTHYVSLVGPDWDTSVAATAVAIDHVVGVYTTTVELDRNLLWNK